MKYKIIFFDVDGTITNEKDGSISTTMKQTITRLKHKGIKVVAATGRPLSMCEDIKQLGIDVFITANGAYAKHKNHVIHKVPIHKTIVQDVYHFAKKENDGLSLFTETFTMNGVENEKIATTLKETLGMVSYPPEHLKIYDEEIYLMCLYADEETVKKYIHEFPNLMFQRWHPFVCNVLQDEVSKSFAVRKVLNYFNLTPDAAIAIGDGENDIDMLELTGLSIAMENGNNNVKMVADFITKKASEDGVTYALQQYGILN
ncbi:Cof-type HAD-IIB family hydrolase [Alkalihalobacterium bogoriense]|uniref:Cof-type HAD-IIB family hydrolase n=1 Tax=Alkalihalobacterium bogoriense TaxID=246272 RepID=UPI00047CA39E|nr:Cof-type HAD-IIB family hydrolase [Alkalihalobacterium bogoriense]